MPKKNQIKGLSSRSLAGGGTMWHWKPSPKEARAGWQSIRLGDDYAKAVLAAIARNAEVEEMERRGAPAADVRRSKARWTFADLVDAYEADPAFLLLKPKSQAEYRSQLRALTRWAEDGATLVRHIDKEACTALRNVLVKDPRRHRTAAMLRVLRIVLGFAVSQNVLASNPAAELNVPEPPRRKHRLTVEQLPGLIAAAGELGFAHVQLGIVLGFYTMQREGDLLATSAFRFRAIDFDISAEARRALAGADGRVLGLFLEQAKTATPVAIPLIPTSRAAVEAAIDAARADGATETCLFQKGGQRVQEWTLQRDFRAACNAAADKAMEAQDHQLAADYRGLQFRDLRRSGMCWMRELAVPVAMIASISGHSIEKTMKILDTYMPRDTRSAAEGMAIAVTRQAERDATEQQGTVDGN